MCTSTHRICTHIDYTNTGAQVHINKRYTHMHTHTQTHTHTHTYTFTVFLSYTHIGGGKGGYGLQLHLILRVLHRILMFYHRNIFCSVN